MSKLTRCDVTVPMRWPEEDALHGLAIELGMSEAGVMRAAFFKFLAERKPIVARKLIVARSIARDLMIWIIALIIPFASLQPGFEARRPRRNGMNARTLAHVVVPVNFGPSGGSGGDNFVAPDFYMEAAA